MGTASGRMEVLARQLAPQPTSADASWDTLALQRLLDHDNHETRQAMKDLMDSDLFVQCVPLMAPPLDPLQLHLLQCAMRGQIRGSKWTEDVGTVLSMIARHDY